MSDSEKQSELEMAVAEEYSKFDNACKDEKVNLKGKKTEADLDKKFINDLGFGS